MAQQGASGPAFAGFEALLRSAPTRPAIMGILNVTPDSFSDGGQFKSADDAVAAGLRMATDGAAILDVGGESTRPGAATVPEAEEAARVVPVIRALAAAHCTVSVDTRSAGVMRAALDAGALIVNDVSGLTHDPEALSVCAARGCGVVLMHMRGTPATMAGLTDYADVVAEVRDALAALRARARAAGIAADRIALDPGIGFAKDAAQNVALLRRLRLGGSGPEGDAEFEVGRAWQAAPMLIGVSRKRFVGTLAGVADPRQRDPGSLAAALFAAARGASILRVHDVPGTAQALKVWAALAG